MEKARDQIAMMGGAISSRGARGLLSYIYDLIMSGGGIGGDAPAKSFVTRGGQTVFKNTLDSPFRLKWW